MGLVPHGQDPGLVPAHARERGAGDLGVGRRDLAGRREAGPPEARQGRVLVVHGHGGGVAQGPEVGAREHHGVAARGGEVPRPRAGRGQGRHEGPGVRGGGAARTGRGAVKGLAAHREGPGLAVPEPRLGPAPGARVAQHLAAGALVRVADEVHAEGDQGRVRVARVGQVGWVPRPQVGARQQHPVPTRRGQPPRGRLARRRGQDGGRVARGEHGGGRGLGLAAHRQGPRVAVPDARPRGAAQTGVGPHHDAVHRRGQFPRQALEGRVAVGGLHRHRRRVGSKEVAFDVHLYYYYYLR